METVHFVSLSAGHFRAYTKRGPKTRRHISTKACACMFKKRYEYGGGAPPSSLKFRHKWYFGRQAVKILISHAEFEVFL